jgi:hypothetical protein
MTPRSEFDKVAPPGLAVPRSLIDVVSAKDRTGYIVAHGFTREEIRPQWWARHEIEITFPSTIDGVSKLTRGDLFAMAETVRSDGDLLRFVWHVLAWGSGDARRNNLKRIESCRASTPLLRQAFEAARASDPRKAYGSLIRPGRAAVPHLGPAFFSKLLYFASEGAQQRCLILDARVARSLFNLGWSIAPTYPTKTFSYNWYTDTYVSYCELLTCWAEVAGNADMFERALFDAGKS